MKLETLFTESDIHELYNSTIIYSILKYQTSSEIVQAMYQSKYEKVQKYLIERNINPYIIASTNLDSLRLQLECYKNIFENNIQLNKPVIEYSANFIYEIIVEEISKKETELDRVSFLFDFITNYIAYSEEYNKYCLSLPLIDGFSFDFKNNVPVDNSINGVLVMGQGICDDICNVIQFLGTNLNLKIKKLICTYNNILHSINLITLSDGNDYLIDATRLIKKDKEKEECFLVSATTLNKNNDYQFSEDILPTTTYKHSIPNYTEEAIKLGNKIKLIAPTTENLNSLDKSKLK